MLACLLSAGTSAAQTAPEPSVLVETATLTTKRVSQQISAYGAIEPDPDGIIVVALPRAGLITRLHVRVGERIEAGDPLLVLDTAPGTRMQFSQAEAARKYAEGQLERTKRLFAEQLATRDQVANAERALSDAQAQVIALSRVGADQNTETLRAVADGIVTALSVNTGDRVAADAPAIFLARSTGLIARLGIEPEDARRVPDAARLELVSPFDDDIRVPTRLDKIGAMINPATRLVDAIAPIPDDSADQLTLGSIMRANITLAEQTVPVVPRSAVLRDESGAYVFVVDRGQARRVDVTVVHESATETGIRTELEAGTVVVKTGNYVLTEGMAIRTAHDDN